MNVKSLKLDFKHVIQKLEFYTKRVSQGEYSGEHRSIYRHRGIEFEEYKDFLPGDDASQIDWRASFRLGKLLTRQFTQTRNVNIYILLDVSNSMIYSSIEKLKCEYAAEIAAALSFYFLKAGDNVGLAMFNNKIVKYLPPKESIGQFFLITKVLSNPSLYGGAYSLSKACSFMSQIIKNGDYVIIISDFIGNDIKWAGSVGTLSRKAEVIGLIVRDPQDLQLNNKVGPVIVSDPYSDKIMFVDMEKARLLYKKETENEINGIKNVFSKHKMLSLLLESNTSFIEPLVSEFSKRKPR